MNAEDEGEEETTSSVSPDGEPEGAYQPDLAENSPLESFPGAAVSPKGEASEPAQEPSPDGEGGATAPDEVSSPDATNAEDEGEEAPAPAEDAPTSPAPALPMANALTYTGAAQALVSAAGEWLYSLDGETYSEAIPTGINAGEYIVYFKAAGDAEPQTLLVTIAKADVVFIAPVAAATGD